MCVIGKSGSGKTTLVEILEKFGHNALPSFTTRPPREPNEKGRTFVSEEEFNKIRDELVAYTFFDGYEHGATMEQINNHDIYIVDVDGYFNLIESIGRDRMVVVHIITRDDFRFDRMKETRGEKEAARRMESDKVKFENLDEVEFDYELINDNKFDLIRNVSKLDYILTLMKDRPDWM